ncbi:MAG: hypothetical protein WKF66_19465 [Pedobacter sp.]
MKLLFSSLIFLVITSPCLAQDKPLPYDERGKLIYYEVVEPTKTPKDSLLTRAKAFLDADAKRYDILKIVGDTLIEAKGKMLLSKNALGMARPVGAVNYNFYAEVRAGKYRFWLTDFIFIPYMRDRYGNFIPSTTIGVPLEREQGKLRASEWLGYQKITAREAKIIGDQFKLTLATKIYTPEAPKPKNTVSTKNW